MIEDLIKKHGQKKVNKIFDEYGYRLKNNEVYDAGNFKVSQKDLITLVNLIDKKLSNNRKE